MNHANSKRTRLALKLSCLALLLTLAVAVTTSQTVVVTLTRDTLKSGPVDLDKMGWKYHPSDPTGDRAVWADPQFDDSSWATLKDSAKPEESDAGWSGIGWFRLHLRVAPELTDVPLNLEMAHLGASEVYLNGRLVHRFGVVGKSRAEETGHNPNASPLGIVLHTGTDHVLAVRYSNQWVADVNSFAAWWLTQFGETPAGINGIGFRSQIMEFSPTGAPRGAGFGLWTYTLGYIVAETFTFFSFGLLHLFLFAFFARQRSNLFFGLSLLSFGINDIFFMNQLAGHYGFIKWYFIWLGLSITWFSAILSLAAFVYTAFRTGLPRRMWFFLAGALFVTIWEHAWPVTYWSPVSTLYTFGMVIEILRVMLGAILRKVPGAGFVAVGILLLSLNLLQGTLVTPFLPFAIGSFGMILAISLYLAREYSRTNEHLAEQLEQVKQLSVAALEHEKVKAENDRRARELEEARQLQLSMLPKALPHFPDLDIAADMRTASEVGGDYYDFHTSEDGTLTIVVGDATGHGLRAGTLVSAVKSLFVSLAHHSDIAHILERMSRVLKEMKLRGLFMAMTMVKVKGEQLTVGVAGMPSVLIWRAVSGTVEEIAIRALPLGVMSNYRYHERELALASEDVVVLMSDGLAERFNKEGEMLDYARIQQALPAVARQSCEAIIAELIRIGEEWGDGHPQDDDITIVVLRAK